MSMLWQWIRKARAAVEKWGKLDLAVAFLQTADQYGHVRRKLHIDKCLQTSTKMYNETKLNMCKK